MSKPRRRQMGKVAKFLRQRQDMIVGRRMKHVRVVIPVYRGINHDTFRCILQLLADYAAQETGIHALPVIMGGMGDPGAARSAACADALPDDECVGLLFIDDDMKFPVSFGKAGDGDNVVGFNPLLRMMSREKDIVSALCTTRKYPLSITAGYEAEDGTMRPIRDPQIVNPHNSEPFQVDFVGFGMVYIRRAALIQMLEVCGGDPRRLFNREIDLKSIPGISKMLQRLRFSKDDDETMENMLKVFRTANQISEDLSFCRKARAAGCEVWVDPSFEVQHIGDYGYGRADWLALYTVEQERKEAEEAAGG